MLTFGAIDDRTILSPLICEISKMIKSFWMSDIYENSLKANWSWRFLSSILMKSPSLSLKGLYTFAIMNTLFILYMKPDILLWVRFLNLTLKNIFMHTYITFIKFEFVAYSSSILAKNVFRTYNWWAFIYINCLLLVFSQPCIRAIQSCIFFVGLWPKIYSSLPVVVFVISALETIVVQTQ